MTAWLLLVGMLACIGGLAWCVFAWARLPQPVDELAARRERRDVRLIRPPFDWSKDEAV